MKTRLLIIDDERDVTESIRLVFEREGYAVATAATTADGLAHLARETIDVVVTDLQLQRGSGLELVKRLRQERPHLPVIMMTGHGTAQTAIEATKLGAYDYVLKGGHETFMDELLVAVRRAADSIRQMDEAVELGRAPSGHERALIGLSRPMQTVYKEIGRLAATPVTVLIRGETGTGKELVARAIYQHSNRADQPLITVNCAAIPAALLESELFGHEPGAFTGAQLRRIGRFEQAHRGTILLDEIGDMTPPAQVKLLRVLQEKTIQRLGGKETIAVDVRVLASTNQNLESLIQTGRFREDLYHRLNVAVIALPPLRDHREDIPELVRYFLQRHGADLGAATAAIQPAALEHLQQQSWPGNVRELENVVRKSLLRSRGYAITRDTVAAALAQSAVPPPAIADAVANQIAELVARAARGEAESIYQALVNELEHELLAQTMQVAEGNQAKAAKWLGISRPTLRDKLRRHGLHPAGDDEPGAGD